MAYSEQEGTNRQTGGVHRESVFWYRQIRPTTTHLGHSLQLRRPRGGKLWSTESGFMLGLAPTPPSGFEKEANAGKFLPSPPIPSPFPARPQSGLLKQGPQRRPQFGRGLSVGLQRGHQNQISAALQVLLEVLIGAL